jgi:ABC-type transporter Mla maintaining outer membrane lipid asymmetry ATPase subunit MlaF
METRTAKVMVIIGGRKSGKTYLANEIVKRAARQKVIVVDTLDHPSWRHLPVLRTPSDMVKLKAGHARIFGHPIQELIQSASEVTDALIIFEDSRKFIKSRVPENIEAMMIDSKQKGTDLLFMYHSYSMVPLGFQHYTDLIFIKKTKAQPTKAMSDRFADIEELLEKAELVRKSSNPYITLKIDCQS